MLPTGGHFIMATVMTQVLFLPLFQVSVKINWRVLTNFTRASGLVFKSKQGYESGQEPSPSSRGQRPNVIIRVE